MIINLGMTRDRESQFELIRIVSMLAIVFYHLFLEMTETLWDNYPIFRGIQIPIHFGVLLFVMISGYFGIKPTFRGGGKLLIMCLVYFLPLAFYHDLKNGDLIRVVKDFFIVSYPRYWFFRDYLFLFLFAPVLNHYLNKATTKQRRYLIFILAFMAIWVGSSQGCRSLDDGKNLTNFMLLYVVGNALKVNRDKWQCIPFWKLITLFLLLNAIVLAAWIVAYDGKISTLIWIASWPYCSPILYINAVLVFMIFGKMSFKSKLVNWVASSVFAVYLIHYHPVTLNNFIKPGADYILNICNNSPSGVIPLFFLYSVIIFIACILIDKIMQPVWRYAGKKFAIIDNKLDERNK